MVRKKRLGIERDKGNRKSIVLKIDVKGENCKKARYENKKKKWVWERLGVHTDMGSYGGSFSPRVRSKKSP